MEADDAVKNAAEKHKSYIMKETLALSLDFAEATDKYDLNGHKTEYFCGEKIEKT